MGQFSAKVSAWVRETKARQEAIYRESAQRVVAVMQTPGPSVANPDGGRGGHMPIDTGFMRASLRAILNGGMLPAVANPDPERSYNYDAGEVNLVIAGAKITDTITAAYTANYARHVHRRYQWAALAAQRWQQIVDEVCAEAKGRASK